MLKKRFYSGNQHPRGWDKFVYDDENIHYAILWLLLENNPTFACNFLDILVFPQPLSVTLKPERGLFDLLFVVNGSHYYCEIKVWVALSKDQFQRQSDFLMSRQATGIYALFTKVAD